MNIALIVAAGSGTRMGNLDCPKQFLLVNNKPILYYTVNAFETNPNIDKILIVTNKAYIKQVKNWSDQYQLTKVNYVVEGGSTRQESVFNGLKALKNAGINENDVILIHDCARPLISQDIINNNIEACKKHDAVDTAIAASDTIMKSLNGDKIDSIPNRKELYQSQTPQTFKFGLIYKAHENAMNNEATDDCMLVKMAGNDIYLVNGSKLNFKITTQEDLELFKSLIK